MATPKKKRTAIGDKQCGFKQSHYSDIPKTLFSLKYEKIRSKQKAGEQPAGRRMEINPSTIPGQRGNTPDRVFVQKNVNCFGKRLMEKSIITENQRTERKYGTE